MEKSIKKLQLSSIIKTLLTISVVFFSIVLFTSRVNAASGAEFNAGRIIDDTVFTSKNSMTVQDIQYFLNSKVPNCNTGFTCLKDYSENSKSAAQIIWEQSQNYSINPQVILVTLQKENGLVTDTSPYSRQYRTAMGFACPDDGSCDPTFFGFTKQVGQGARHFRNYFDNNPNWFVPYTIGQATIKWSPNSNCGSSSVYINNRATASLYSYTPYRPNQAALNNLYGTGDGCSAYGNRNFWRDFTDWFGSTYSSEYITQVIQAPGDSRYFLRVGNTKMWIPTTETYFSWRLNTQTIIQVDQTFFSSLSTLPDLKQVGRAGPYYYFVSNGMKHYIPSSQYLQLWGYTQQDVDYVPATGLLNNIPEGGYLGRFAKSSDSNDNSRWLMNGSQKNKIPNDDILNQWGYSASAETTVTPEFLALKQTGPDAGRYVSSSGLKYLVDSARKISLQTPSQEQNWGSNTFVTMNSFAPGFLPTVATSNFLTTAGDPKWYLLDGGKKRFIPNGNILNTWGYNNNLLAISPALMTNLTNANNAQSIVRVLTPSDRIFILDGKKHLVPDTNTLSGWSSNPSAIDTYSEASISQLADGSIASTVYQITGNPNFYTVDNSVIRQIPDSNTLNAWGVPRLTGAIQLSQALVYQYPQSTGVSFRINDGTNDYYLEDGYYYRIPTELKSSWGFSAPTVISPSTLARFQSKPDIKEFISVSGTNYLMTNGSKASLGGLDSAYGIGSSNSTTLTKNYLPTTSPASYLVKSSNPANNNIWLMSQGKKYTLDFAAQVGFGFLSTRRSITQLTDSTVSSYTDAGVAPTLIRKQSGWGVKLVNFGGSMSFPDGETFFAYGAQNAVIVSDVIYDSLPLNGSLSRLVRDDSGKIYFIENGTKRWIWNSNTYNNQYKGRYPVVYLYGTTISLIPNGPSIP